MILESHNADETKRILARAKAGEFRILSTSRLRIAGWRFHVSDPPDELPLHTLRDPRLRTQTTIADDGGSP